jgi:hypothetical protein
MIHLHKFVSEDDVNYYKSMSNDEIKEMLYIGKDFDNIPDGDFKEKLKKFDFRKLYGLPDGDIDVLLEQFRKENFTKYCRKSDWRYSFTKVLNNDGSIIDYRTWTASFKFINKWSQETEPQEYKIIIDENEKILWIGYNFNYYFISVGENIYRFTYEHKHISLYPNVCFTDEHFSENDMEVNDQLIVNRKNIGVEKFGSFDIAKTILHEEKIGVKISINECFEKGFFYKGPKWNKFYEYMYSKDTTILISIQARNNLFYIEIENITYPVSGYILLDINDIRIVEAKIINKISFINKIKSSYKNWTSNNNIYLNRETHRVFTQDEIDVLLTALHGSIINRIKLIIKRIILFFRNSLEYKLIIIRNKFVYIIGLDGLKKELREDSYYGFEFDNYINNGGKLQ